MASSSTNNTDGDVQNFLRQFRDKDTKQLKKFTAQQFLDVWSHYDKDGDGYIEGKELDDFMREFISSVIPGCIGPEVISDQALKDAKEELLGAYDDNDDHRIEIGEMAEILPTEENFILLFRRDNPLESSVEFMKLWKRFDTDNSGFIETDELREFLVYLFNERKAQVPDEKIDEYTQAVLKLFDTNGDGKLQLSEMARLLPVKENFLCKPLFKHASKLTSFDIDCIFRKYDRDRSGTIEGDELEGFLKDLLEISGESYDDSRLSQIKEVILSQWDVNHDGQIGKDELKMILMEQSRRAQEEEYVRKMQNNC